VHIALRYQTEVVPKVHKRLYLWRSAKRSHANSWDGGTAWINGARESRVRVACGKRMNGGRELRISGFPGARISSPRGGWIRIARGTQISSTQGAQIAVSRETPLAVLLETLQMPRTAHSCRAESRACCRSQACEVKDRAADEMRPRLDEHATDPLRCSISSEKRHLRIDEIVYGGGTTNHQPTMRVGLFDEMSGRGRQTTGISRAVIFDCDQACKFVCLMSDMSISARLFCLLSLEVEKVIVSIGRISVD
jgi:hypothetical protein